MSVIKMGVDKVKEFKNRFKSDKKFRIIVIVTTVAALAIYMLVDSVSQSHSQTLSAGSQVKRYGNTENANANYEIPNNTAAKEALLKKDAERKDNTTGSYIDTIRKPAEEKPEKVSRREANEKSNKQASDAINSQIKRIENDQKAREEEKQAEKPAITINRQQQSKRGGGGKERTIEDEINELNALYAIADSYTQASPAYVSMKGLDDYDVDRIQKSGEEKAQTTTTYAEDFKIMPGSTFMANLLTPINSNYPEMKPLIKFTSGDLAGWIGVGNSSLKSLGSGMVITITKIVDPQGNEKAVNGLAFNSQNGNPAFKDDIDNYLAQRLGYGVLGDLFNTAGSVISSRIEDKVAPDVYGLNNRASSSGQYSDPVCAQWQDVGGVRTCMKWNHTVPDVNQRVQKNDTKVYPHSIPSEIGLRTMGSGASRAGSVIGGIFSDLANGYKTEITVNPQAVLVIFY
jgi:hypothetical protein